MAFDTSSKHKFSNLPNTFPENPIKPHLRNVFSIGGSSSNLLSHHHSHHLIGNSHFNIEGYSMNPFSGLHNPLLNQYESLHHHSSSDTSTYGSMGAAPLAATGATGEVHELQSKGLLNCSQGMNQIYRPMIFEESGNTSLELQTRKASKTDKKLNAVKRQWTPPEDWLLTQMVQIYGENWSEINQHLNGRTGKQCRERWRNHLRPDIKVSALLLLLLLKPAAVPMHPKTQLSALEGDPLPDPAVYGRLIGRLIYLTLSRPDITFAVHKLTQFLSHPRAPHLQAAHHLLQYLKSKPGQGLLFSGLQ